MSNLLRNTANHRCVLSLRFYSKNAVRLQKIPNTTHEKATDVFKSTHKVRNIEKYFLKWIGKYKSIDDVPAYLPRETVDYARNRIRIRLANILMLLTVVCCFAMIISGKRAAARGESVQKMNLDWHKKMNEEQKKSS